MREIGLDLQPNKTNIVEFSKVNITKRNDTVRCFDKVMPIKKETKFLGILFDDTLRFDNQCRKIKEKVIIANALFRFTNKVTWGLEINTALMLYKSLIRSIIDYGSAIFTKL